MMNRVGNILAEERTRQGVSLTRIADQTHIRQAFLVALEESDFDALPSVGHSKGFVISYAQYLGLDSDALAAQLGEEMSRNASRGRGAFDEAKKTDKKSTDTHEIPWKVVWVLAVLVVIAGGVAWGLTTFVFNDPTLSPRPPLRTTSTTETDEQIEGEE